MRSIDEKTAHASKLLDRAYAHHVGDDEVQQAVEMICDMLHWCEAHSQDFELLLLRAMGRRIADLDFAAPPPRRR